MTSDAVISSALAHAPEVIAELEYTFGKDFDPLSPGIDDNDRAHVAVLLLADQIEAQRLAHEKFVAALNDDHRQTLRIVVIRLLRLAADGMLARVRHPQELRALAKFIETRVPGLFEEYSGKLGAIGVALLREELAP